VDVMVLTGSVSVGGGCLNGMQAESAAKSASTKAQRRINPIIQCSIRSESANPGKSNIQSRIQGDCI